MGLKMNLRDTISMGLLFSLHATIACAQCNVDNTVQINLYTDNNCANFVASTCYDLVEQPCFSMNSFTSDQVFGLEIVNSPGNVAMDYFGQNGCAGELANKDGKFGCAAAQDGGSGCCGTNDVMISFQGGTN
ncbi:hypothetical protein F5884DRAFT_858227 [Xylogone sp. PMI_703]|nr:hypothetical protein F5884DRAFT_858227 [Xylogone sp. PMI_703]